MKSFLLAASALALSASIPALAADVYVPVQGQFPEEYFEGNKAAGYIDLHYGFLWPYSGGREDDLD